jgi:hypothetical protein
MEETKKCTKCGSVKPAEEFRQRKDGKRLAMCIPCKKEYDKEWFKKNPTYKADYIAKHPGYNRDYHLNNIERVRKNRKTWRANHLDEVKAIQRKANRKSYLTPQGKLGNRMSSDLYYCVKNRRTGWAWEKILGYTTLDLMAHLEKQFKDGMTWENYGSYWCIDHIIPKSAFNYQTTDDSEFKTCWALANIQPLTVQENGFKYNKIEQAKAA